MLANGGHSLAGLRIVHCDLRKAEDVHPPCPAKFGGEVGASESAGRWGVESGGAIDPSLADRVGPAIEDGAHLQLRRRGGGAVAAFDGRRWRRLRLSLIHISEPTR